MKTKNSSRNRVNLVTLGCSKNVVDSEVMMAQLRANQVEVTHESPEPADVVIINTCGFIQNAKEESIETILRYSEARKTGEIEKLYVTGCLSERYREQLKQEIPWVDSWFGTMELPMLLKKFHADYKHELVGERILTTSRHYAYLKISEGCDRPCSFCAIPLMRGKHVSRSIDELVKEARFLAKNGTRELLLIAQDSTYYGLDLYGKRRLPDLMRSLSDVEGIEWIRLHYAYPAGFPLEVLDVIQERDNICNYLDLPLQHSSDRMLKLMRRGITKVQSQKLIRTIRNRVPEIALRTTLIVGHPGETEEEFQDLLKFVEENRFERLGAFSYSHEEDTHSFSFDDHIPKRLKQKRMDLVMGLQAKISYQINQSKVGATLNVLIDRIEGDFFIGRTEHDSPEVDNEVLIPAQGVYLRIGDYAKIKITEAAEFDLFGSPIS